MAVGFAPIKAVKPDVIQCRKPFDTFTTRGVCPHCGAQYVVTRCLHCGQSHPIDQWLVVAPVPVPPTIA